MTELNLTQLTDYLYEIPQTGDMRVPGRIYASPELMETQKSDEAVQQVRNVACLPGIVKYSLAMPDFHWGYGFPIGGVAAFDLETGVISPGGVGYDINCGVRLMRTNLTHEEVKPKLREVVKNLFKPIPAGVGSHGAIPKLSQGDARKILTEGARWAVEHGHGKPGDLDYIEDGGRMAGADPDVISERAIARGLGQIGTLGSGNHFLELQVIDEIYQPLIADRMGLQLGGIAVAIHSGSRGFGYQVCDDSLKVMGKAAQNYGIKLADRQLACAPLSSPEAKEYLAAMACAANYAWVNRQVMMAITERVLARTMDMSDKELDMRLIYDVCHNIAKFEDHDIDGKRKKVCVHRKGATRAFGPGHPLVPEAYREIGQPVLVPGDMGRYSFLCIGTNQAMADTFGSTCHGAGRQFSRSAMIRQTKGRNLFKEMENRGVIVMAQGMDSVGEEMPEAYKDVALVVDVMEKAKISTKVVRLKPIGVVKG